MNASEVDENTSPGKMFAAIGGVTFVAVLLGTGDGWAGVAIGGVVGLIAAGMSWWDRDSRKGVR
jgi:hypothetical protein